MFLPRTAGLLLTLAALPYAAHAAPPESAFRLESADIQDGQRLPEAQVFKGFGCSGENRSPALHWHGAPTGTKSFALTVYDPDAPTGSGWWHWTVFNLPSGTTHLPGGAGNAEGILPPSARQGRTDFGQTGYGGACPPPGHGTHHYQFIVWALDVEALDLPADAPGAMVGYMVRAHALGQARLTALYSRAPASGARP